MTPLLLLMGAALSGIALVRRVLRDVLDPFEQCLWGLVSGWMLATICGYLLARLVGRISSALALSLTAAMCLAALLLWLPTLKNLLRGWRPRFALRSFDAGLCLVLLLFAPLYLRLFSTRMLAEGTGGVYTGGSAFYDLPWHLAISSSFLYGQNFPPLYTPLPPEPLLYPYLPDFQTALLGALGMSFHRALVITGAALALAATGLFYAFARRIVSAQVRDDSDNDGGGNNGGNSNGNSGGDAHAQKSAALAAILFLLNGGFGFIYFFEDWRESGKPFVEFWSHLNINYASLPDRQLHWTNVLVDMLLPQRTSLYGLSCALMCFTLFAVAWRGWSEEEESGGRWTNWRVLLPAGVITGALPLFHTHTYMALGLVSGFLFILRPRRAWLVFWLPAVLLAVPHFLSLAGHVAAEGFMHFQPGWRGHGATSWPLYWLRNIGLPLLLIVPAWWAAQRTWRIFYLAFVGLFVVSLLFNFTPNEYDNIKLMYYTYALTCILVASWLVRLASIDGQRFLATLLALASIASGLLAVQFESLDRRLLFTDRELDAARFVCDHAAPHALFLTAPTVHQPILSLSGRPVLRGDTAWVWSHGYEFRKREADIKKIYAGGDEAGELLRYYDVDFVYLGRAERDYFQPDRAFFEKQFPVFYDNGDLIIYDTRRLADEDGARSLPLREPPPREFAARLAKDPYQFIVEFPRASYALYRLHKVAYGTTPRYEEFLRDLEWIGRGVYVGAQGWQERLEANKTALTNAWAEGAEFKSRYERVTNGEYVDALYANANVTPDGKERAGLVALLDRSTDTRASIVRRVAENREMYRRDYDAAFVLVHYFAYLRRGPGDPPDKNLDGFNFWLEDLKQTGDRRSLSRVFMASGEYIDQTKIKPDDSPVR
ncbi:MAG: hypothetical protein WCD76_10910 [Pyrinomonadaceae bacterium]